MFAQNCCEHVKHHRTKESLRKGDFPSTDAQALTTNSYIIRLLCAMAPRRVMKKKKKKTRTKAPRRKLGQASPLHGPLWNQWCQHLLRIGPSWLYMVVTLSHMLCCRVTEVLALRAGDFNFRHGTVRIKPLKRQPEARSSNDCQKCFNMFYNQSYLLSINLWGPDC